MDNSNFAHLHVHNEYSLLDGVGTAQQYADKAAEMGFKYLALTNHGNVDGCFKFQKACATADIQSILGSELYIVPDATNKKKKEKKGHIVILVKNQLGWEQLCALISKSYLEGFYSKPRTDYESILDCDMSGWVITTACISSFLNQPKGEDFLKEIQSRMKGNVYFEIMPHDYPAQNKFHEHWKGLPLDLVATNDCHYVEREDDKVQDVLLAIQTNKTWDDPKRWSFDFRGLHLRSADEMMQLFQEQGTFTKTQYTKAMRNTIKIARQCYEFHLEPLAVSLPKPSKWDEADFYDLVATGLEEKDVLEKEGYQDRAEEEMEVISSKGFENYYLIVKDLVEWCKANDIMVGPGRGSVGGSLLAWLMGITQIDSIQHKLSFSRFISEDRIDLPDIDLDFEKGKRHLVIKYLKKTYGPNNTAGVSTYGKLQSRGALRDIGRIFKIPNHLIDPVAKSVYYNSSNALQQALETKAGKLLQKSYGDEVAMVQRLDGQIRNAGQHAAAIILADHDLRNGHRCTLRKGKGGDSLINWDMKDSEFFGLVKLDILGLSTLSVLNYAKQLINESRKDLFEYENLQFDSPEVFQMISEGRTAGIFQLVARPTTELCKELVIESFEDIVAAIALVRPGPTDSGMTSDFIDRKRGKHWTPLHPIYEKVTADTFGLLVYQEQVMQVIHLVGGLSEATADQIRKVIGKKRDPAEFEPYQKQFVDGCKKQNTLSPAEANEFWVGLLKWASYGFNRAHSVEYAVIAYWTAWLKVHYPIEFYCAHLSYGEFDSARPDKSKQRVIDEVISLGYQIIPPKVKKSDPCKWVFQDRILYMPFMEIKGIGESGAEKCCTVESTTCKGFFDIEVKTDNGANEEMLKAIDAYDDESIPECINKYLEFDMLSTGNPEYLYPNLTALIPYDTDLISVETIAKLEGTKHQFLPPDLIKRNRFHNDKVTDCEKCGLGEECTQPVVSSMGQYNVFIVMESPGPDGDKEGKGAVGPEGDLLWDEIGVYGYNRRHFHVSNTCRCYPKKAKTPTKPQIDECFNWVMDEIEATDCRLVLACGNIAQYGFARRDKGIQALSGTTEWIDDLGLWVCWCVSPSSVLRNDSNRNYFEKGIENFIQKLELLI